MTVEREKRNGLERRECEGGKGMWRGKLRSVWGEVTQKAELSRKIKTGRVNQGDESSGFLKLM